MVQKLKLLRSRILALVGAFVVCFTTMSANLASDLIISEYCEYNQTVTSPNYYNHYIEIYNGTGADVDMTQYQLWRSFNAFGWNNNAGVLVTPITLQGILPTGKTYVITRENLVATPNSLAPVAAQTCSYLNISGDDAIGLAKNDGVGNFVLIDLFGSSSVDPGEGWSVAGVTLATQNHTLVRKPSVCNPTTDWTLSAGTDAASSQWIVLAQNDISDVNRHTGDCGGQVIIDNGNHKKYSALFIGNSYTYYNDMPKLVNSIANSVQDTLITSQSTIGGYFLDQHFTNVDTRALLSSKVYDFVVLQEQSVRPALDSATTAYKFFQYSQKLDSVAKVFSPNSQTIYYMTWGRKYGDATNCPTNPNVCTYEKMDSMLRVRYRMAQAETGSLISPIGAVRNYLIKNFPEIELYDPDNSHPSAAGSFVSAMTFYTTIFQKDPTATSYDFTIGNANATTIRNAVKAVVFDSLSYWNSYKAEQEIDLKVNVTKPLKTDVINQNSTFTAEVSATSSALTISAVDFYLNGVLVGTKSSAPYQIDLSAQKAGANALVVVATASSGDKVSTAFNFSVIAAPVVIPAKIEAEDYIDFFGIQTEAASEGTLNVGWTETGDWLDYSITVPAEGDYNVNFRVGSAVSGAQLALSKDGGATVLGGVTIPNTGAWQNWVTVSTQMNLTSGTYPIRLHITSSGFNINWFSFEAAGSPTSIANGDKSTLTIYPNPASQFVNIPLASGDSHINIFNVSGTQVYASAIGNDEILKQISLVGWIKGMYVVKILTTNGVQREQLLAVL